MGEDGALSHTFEHEFSRHELIDTYRMGRNNYYSVLCPCSVYAREPLAALFPYHILRIQSVLMTPHCRLPLAVYCRRRHAEWACY